MLSRLIEMVSFILAKSIENEEDDWVVLRNDLTEQLEGRGFNGQEIDIAFEVANRIRSRIEDAPSVPITLKTNQVYHFLEMLKISKEARGFLIALVSQGLISPEQKEEIVERAFYLDYPEIGLEEMQFLVNLVIAGEGWPGEDSPNMSFHLH